MKAWVDGLWLIVHGLEELEAAFQAINHQRFTINQSLSQLSPPRSAWRAV
jgi:hypothetical protein